jgi:hypothetical protein
MAAKIRFQYDYLEADVEGDVDPRGYQGDPDALVHFTAVRLIIRIQTQESDERLARLADLVHRYCPVNCLIRAAVPDYTVTWQRLPAMDPRPG